MPRARWFFALLLAALPFPAAAQPQEGDRLFARWEPDGYSYPVTVQKRENGQAYVHYTDGTKQWVPDYRIGYFNVRVGTVVYGNWLNRGLYYRGKVTRRDGNNIRIHYDDGDVEDTTIDLVRMRLVHYGARKVGCNVMGRWAPDGYWYPGVVKEIKEGKYLVYFDDGDKAWLEERHVFPYSPVYGDVVQGNWLGKGTYYRGRITKRNGNQVRVHYDDGDVEDTTIRRLRMIIDPSEWQRSQ